MSTRRQYSLRSASRNNNSSNNTTDDDDEDNNNNASTSTTVAPRTHRAAPRTHRSTTTTPRRNNNNNAADDDDDDYYDAESDTMTNDDNHHHQRHSMQRRTRRNASSTDRDSRIIRVLPRLPPVSSSASSTSTTTNNGNNRSSRSSSTRTTTNNSSTSRVGLRRLRDYAVDRSPSSSNRRGRRTSSSNNNSVRGGSRPRSNSGSSDLSDRDNSPLLSSSSSSSSLSATEARSTSDSGGGGGGDQLRRLRRTRSSSTSTSTATTSTTSSTHLPQMSLLGRYVSSFLQLRMFADNIRSNGSSRNGGDDATLIEDDQYVDIPKLAATTTAATTTICAGNMRNNRQRAAARAGGGGSASSSIGIGSGSGNEELIIDEDDILRYTCPYRSQAQYVNEVKRKLMEQQQQQQQQQPTAVDHDSTTTSDCVICQEAMDVDLDRYCSGVSNLVVLPCGHAFHAHCLNEWIDSNSTCPLCRSVIRYNFASFANCFKFSSTIDCESDFEVLQISYNKSLFDRALRESSSNSNGGSGSSGSGSGSGSNNRSSHREPTMNGSHHDSSPPSSSLSLPLLDRACVELSLTRLKNILSNMYVVFDVMTRELCHVKSSLLCSIESFEREHALVVPVQSYSSANSAQVQEQLTQLSMSSVEQFQRMMYYSLLKQHQIKLQSKFPEIETMFQVFVLSHGLQVVDSEQKIKSLLFALIGTRLLVHQSDEAKYHGGGSGDSPPSPRRFTFPF